METKRKNESGLIKTIKILFLVWACFPLYSHAQYFGRNKVQYQDFDFKVLKTDHFDIYHYPQTDSTIAFLAELSETWYNHYSVLFGHKFIAKNPVIIYRNASHFQQTKVIPQLIGIGTGGVTEGYKNRVVLPLAESWESTNHVLGHELVHAFQYRLLKENDSLGLQYIANLPLWMVEGLAEYLSIGTYDTHTSMWMADAVLYNDIPTIEQMNFDFKYFPYRYGHAMWSYISGTWGDDIIPILFRDVAEKGLDLGIFNTLGVTPDSLSKMWKEELIKTYSPLISSRTKPEEVGDRILAPEKGAGKNNVSPSVSPDGKYIIYNSEKSIFTFDLFLADAKTGKTIRKLASTSTDAHLSAISFIESSGAWSSDSKFFAFVVFSKGTNMIYMIDPYTGKTKKKIHNKDIGAISNPKWSPDGKKIVFAGSDGSTTNLYQYNIETDELKPLTNTRHTDMMPSFSADGKWIVFITDRTEFYKKGVEEYGPLRPAMLSTESNAIILLPYFKHSKHINPLFSPDGKSVYFISDRNGFSNIYRMDLESHQKFQVTDVATGVSGISQYSPALSISDDGTLIFSVFEKGNYIVYSLDAEKAQGKLVEEQALLSIPGMLPPLNRRGKNIVENYLSSFNPKEIPEDSLIVKNYIPRISLDFVGSAGIGIGTNRYGSAFGGGVAGVFTDMLNNHLLYAAVQINGGLKDFGGQAVYINQSKRINFGASFSHVPFRSVSSFLGVDTTTVDGSPIVSDVVAQIVERIYQDNFTLFTSYPFSMVNRAELLIGYTRLSFEAELIKSFVAGNSIFKEEREKLPSPEAINLYNAAIAYVGDNSYYGMIAPLKGYRYRFELGTNTGSFNFVTPLVDYRHYIYQKPVSFSFRTLSYGRFLGDADQLSTFFIGNESLIRGYSLSSFDPAECHDENNPDGCPVFDRLFGSKFSVFNFEIRLPFTGVEEISVISSKYVPLSLNAFFDAGVSWTDESSPKIKFIRNSQLRTPVFSTGLSARLGIFGYFALELYYAYPFQRPEKGPHLGLFITPAW